jgi:anti-sigma factor (TIGR02949 family)
MSAPLPVANEPVADEPIQHESILHRPIPHEVPGAADCGHVLDHLNEYLDSQMTEADERRMRDHLAHCAPCLAELSAEELVRELVRRSCVERAPEELRVRIFARLTVTTHR